MLEMWPRNLPQSSNGPSLCWLPLTKASCSITKANSRVRHSSEISGNTTCASRCKLEAPPTTIQSDWLQYTQARTDRGNEDYSPKLGREVFGSKETLQTQTH